MCVSFCVGDRFGLFIFYRSFPSIYSYNITNVCVGHTIAFVCNMPAIPDYDNHTDVLAPDEVHTNTEITTQRKESETEQITYI